MNNSIKYKLISERSIKGFNLKLAEKIEEGWLPFNNVVITPVSPVSISYSILLMGS